MDNKPKSRLLKLIIAWIVFNGVSFIISYPVSKLFNATILNTV